MRLSSAILLLATLLSLMVAVVPMASAVVQGRLADPLKSAQTVSLRIEGREHGCSAVVIGRHLLVLAGHCLDSQAPQKLSIEITNEVEVTKTSRVRSTRWEVVPGYDATTSRSEDLSEVIEAVQFDLAYIKISADLFQVLGLSENSMSRVGSSAADLRAALANQSGNAISFGYGKTSLTARAGVEKRELWQNVSYVPALNYLKVFSLDAQTRVCQGDSGSGVFLQQKGTPRLFLAGILAGISQTCMSHGSVAAYVDLSMHLCWIQRRSGAEVSNLNCP